MLTTLLWLGLGLSALLVGGELTVRGATGLSRAFGVSPLFIGLTVVAFGSSTPELVVNVIGSLRGQTELAFGGVIGSNLANIGLVLALATIVASIRVQGQIVRREIPLLLLVTAVLVVLSQDSLLRGEAGVLDATDGLVLLALFTLFLYVNISDVLQHGLNDPLTSTVVANPAVPGTLAIKTVAAAQPELPEPELANIEEPPEPPRVGVHAAVTLLGLAVLLIGGELTVTHASELARIFGASETVIGLAIVAVGTSLPELVTSLVAALRGQPDLAVGNVIGSNLFNTTFVLGISALITPLPIPPGGTLDLLVNFGIVAMLIPFALTGPRRLVRIEGFTLMAFYLGYLAFRFS